MSFASGIGSLQQTISPSASADIKPVVKADRSEGVAPANGASNENGGNFDQANLSSAGGVVAQALAGSDTRYAKVAAVQQAIAAGSYSVSSSDVADKMIQSLLE
jgi:negative regulator of flagellin synthesis FlgM